MGEVVSTTAALSDEQFMPRSRAPHGKKYAAPAHQETIMLSEALRGTARLPSNSQLSFLRGEENARGDARIFYAGDISLLARPCVSIVGTRQASDAGLRATKWLTRKLVDAGIVIVSGLAYGVDTAAHTTAMKSGGKTIAVIGTSLDKSSPSENARLQEEIYRDHLLISQFKTGENVYRTNFPVRNRLMAVLTDATVVMEARDGSGTLHQAAECTKLGRWLFIAKSVIDDPKITWPKDFLKYETCVPLARASQIVDRVLKSSQ